MGKPFVDYDKRAGEYNGKGAENMKTKEKKEFDFHDIFQLNKLLK